MKYTYNWNHSLKKEKKTWRDFPGGSMIKNPPSNAGNMGSNHSQGTKIPQDMCHSQEIFFFKFKTTFKKKVTCDGRYCRLSFCTLNSSKLKVLNEIFC